MNVHVLHRGAGSTLAEVVEPGYQADPLLVAEHEQVDAVGLVGAPDVEEAVSDDPLFPFPLLQQTLDQLQQ